MVGALELLQQNLKIKIFSRQEYWSGLPCPSPGTIPNAEIELRSALQADSIPAELPGKSILYLMVSKFTEIWDMHDIVLLFPHTFKLIVLPKGFPYQSVNTRASLVAMMVENLLAKRETWICSLGWADPLKKGMATHFSILAWRIPWTEEPVGLQCMGLQRVGHNWVLNTHSE